MKRDQPEYNPKSLSEGGRVLEQIPFARLTAKEKDFLIIVYRFTFGFQRFWSPGMKRGKWATLMGLTLNNFWKIRKSLEEKKIILSTENKNLLNMRIERHVEKWKLFSPQRSQEIDDKFSPERTKLLSTENSTSLPREQNFSPERTLYRDEFIDKKRDESLDKGEVSPFTPSFSLSPFKDEKPKDETSEWPLFLQENEQQKSKLRYMHPKRSKAKHKKIVREQVETFKRTGNLNPYDDLTQIENGIDGTGGSV